MKATGKFTVKSWDEKPYDEPEGGIKLTKATTVFTYEGDIVGESLGESVMAYPTEDTSSYVGLERITGTLGGKKGSFVLQTNGTYGDKLAHADSTIIVGSGTGELQGIRGTAKLEAPEGNTGVLSLEYDFE